MESLSTGNKFDGGIPGALTNRPPEPAAAPIEVEGEQGEKKPEPLPTDQRKESTTNYEVDKTVQHTQLPVGNIRRLSAAVVVNYRRVIDGEGNITHTPLSAEEIQEINKLVKDAIGYNEERGDTLTVTNNLFSDVGDASQGIPIWKDPEMIMLAMEIAKQLIIAAIVLFFLLKVLRPYLKSLMHDPALEEKQRALLADNTAADADEQSVQFAADGTPLLDQKATEEEVRKRQLEENIQKIRSMAREEPAIVANVVKEWVNNG